ncbi:MAG: sensor histidine kinase KdpD [Chloroflexi bacterium]|nr:sensor histidine kinase KdpD [Chloroflexota bacterium]
MFRPDPDQLLAHVQAEEAQKKRGRMKIFLGYVAGVGKTYAMLEAAHQRKAEGVDVVIGYVETHRRAETESLVGGLELIPRQQIPYRGTTLPEMDLDAVLARRPQLVLVDELAHTNAPGSRHPKRYQDVEELLAAGIDVYTTLNVQHLESLNDVVAQITEVVIRETLPDRVIDAATEIELIDLPPDELLQRLREGKVYVPEQAARAIQKFFRKGNLTALREIAMRRAAERVDEQMRAYMQTRAIPGPWPASERLLVCIGPNPLGERLVRSARRLADELRAEWFAVYVEITGQSHLTPAANQTLTRNLRLAEELGAKSAILSGPTIAEAVLAYAHKHNVTKIIVGKPLRSRFKELLQGSIVDQIIRFSGTIDIYVISNASQTPSSAETPRSWLPHRPWRRYLQSLALVIVATLLSELIRPFLPPTNLVMPYLAAIAVAATYLGSGPSVLASFLSVVAFDFFFVPPYYTFSVSDTQYLLTFAGLFTVGLVISSLAARAREQAEAASFREGQTAALYAFSRDLAAAANLDEMIQVISSHLSENFGREVVILLPTGQPPTLQPCPADSRLDESEMAVAVWAYEHGQPAGRDTDTLPSARIRYLPLKTGRNVIGVLGVKPPTVAGSLAPGQRHFMDVFTSQATIAIERVQLAEQARQAQLLQATESLQTALLNSISHDLRTPLVAITGALSSLREDGSLLDEATREELLHTAWGEAERLNRLVGNLLDMTRLESGALKINLKAAEVQDLVGVTLAQLGSRLQQRPINLEIPPDLPLVQVDFSLMVQVLVNLVDNAVKYSPPDQPILIRAREQGDELILEVVDQGMGIPDEDLERVFDKFYRVQRADGVAGTGLGLSISKGIVEAHRGRVWARHHPGGGTIVGLSLPLNNELIHR